MKKILLILVLVSIPKFALAQVGINTTSPNAQLDIKSSNQLTPSNTDGILIPKIDAFPLTNPTAAQNSMLVYLTTTSAGRLPGFYYWDNAGVSWKGFGSSGWELTGNLGTNPAINFVGTTDAVPLKFKVFNQNSGLLDLSGNSFFGLLSGNAQTGNENTAIGKSALSATSAANGNTAVGFQSLKINDTGAHNTAIGYNSLPANTSGGENAALGFNSLATNSSGFANTGVGSQSLYNTKGSNNVGIGYFAGSNISTGSGNVAIGLNAQVAAPTGSAQLTIGNSVFGTTIDDLYNARIGVGTKAPSAKFEVASPFNPATPAITDGILIPQVTALVIPASMTAAQNSMMVFLKTVSGTNQPGFYYWDQPTTSWKGVGSNTANAWNLTGNSGTNPATNFIGTTDFIPLNFRINNENAGRIDLFNSVYLGYQVGSGPANLGLNNTGIGSQALFSNTTGDENTAIGSLALYNNTGGGGNTAIGFGSIKGGSGSYNTANGYGSLGSNAGGGSNNAFGTNALGKNTSGSDNVAFGSAALYGNTIGENNTAIGTSSLYTNITGFGNVAVGYQAGYNETGSNKLYIDNSNTATPLIYGDFATDRIRVNGYEEVVYTQLTANGDGQNSLYALRNRDSQNDGTGYTIAGTNNAIAARNLYGDVYTFGVAGYSDNDFNRSGGVFGGCFYMNTHWGSLGYKSSANTPYGVYASGTNTYGSGTGRMSNTHTETGIGGGFYGGIIGSWSKGNVIGQVSSGSLFASYNSGDEYTAGRQVEIVETPSGKKAAYTMTSTESVVYKKGKIALQNGSAHVAFDVDYAQLLGDDPVVTTTPMGQCNGIYIESVDKSGFTIRELNNGTSNVTVSWIAVGDRIDSGQPALPDVLAQDFDSNINEVLFNENDLNGKAKAMWSDGKKIQFGELPENLKEKVTKKDKL